MSIIVLGCSSGPQVIPFEQEKIDVKAEVPLPKCKWPELLEIQVDGQDAVYMTKEELEKQVRCKVTEQGNYDIAKNNAMSVDDAVSAFNSLVDKAVLHNNYAQHELDRVEEQRQDKRNELWVYQIMLIAGLLISL